MGSIGDLEITVAEYIDWFNHRRLHGQIGLIPHVETRARTWPATPGQRGVYRSSNTAPVMNPILSMNLHYDAVDELETTVTGNTTDHCRPISPEPPLAPARNDQLTRNPGETRARRCGPPRR